MPRCANGHMQRLGLKCKICGQPLSYKEVASQLLDLPSVQPDFGRTASLYVGMSPGPREEGYSIRVTVGDSPKQTKNEFVLAKTQGGTWHDFYSNSGAELSRWLNIVAFGESTLKFLFADASDPLSVLAVSALPQLSHTAMVAMTADEESTPVEQNASYVAVSAALRRGFQVLAFPRYLAKQILAAEDGGEPSNVASFSQVVGGLLRLRVELMDLLEKDRHIGVGTHLLLPILSGSLQVYGKPANVFVVQSYQFPKGVALGEVKTFHTLVSCEKDLRAEFEEGFSQFRNRAVKGALNAECRVSERPDQGSFDLFTIVGLDGSSVLGESEDGYKAVAKRAPALRVESVA